MPSLPPSTSTGPTYSGGAASKLRQFRIIDIVTQDTFEFHAMPQGGYSESKHASWSSNNIIGRSSAILGYDGSEGRSISLSIPIYSSIEQGDGRTTQTVKEEVAFFMSLVYPDYTGLIKPPHRILLLCGDQLQLEGVVTSIDVNYRGPFDPATGLTHHAEVTISITEVEDIPVSFQEVRQIFSASARRGNRR